VTEGCTQFTEFDACQFINNNVIGLWDRKGRIAKSDLVQDIAKTNDPAPSYSDKMAEGDISQH
jgi:hypothetical protein